MGNPVDEAFEALVTLSHTPWAGQRRSILETLSDRNLVDVIAKALSKDMPREKLEEMVLTTVDFAAAAKRKILTIKREEVENGHVNIDLTSDPEEIAATSASIEPPAQLPTQEGSRKRRADDIDVPSPADDRTRSWARTSPAVLPPIRSSRSNARQATAMSAPVLRDRFHEPGGRTITSPARASQQPQELQHQTIAGPSRETRSLLQADIASQSLIQKVFYAPDFCSGESYLSYTDLPQPTQDAIEKKFKEDYLSSKDKKSRHARILKDPEKYLTKGYCVNNYILGRVNTAGSPLQMKVVEKEACDHCVRFGRLCVRPMYIDNKYQMVLYPLPRKHRVGSFWTELCYWFGADLQPARAASVASPPVLRSSEASVINGRS
ncbi:hypothetical protein T440DRAFT_466957 [Plenodomus tracheiphilus IPT5]|uniref:Uncharacterized protein n=1 Tax=Plenodomus tracheiphilus IPT5 TaxID=1408161 RepID=A0A6A7B9N9_9PLEO|nr:hypothetical protein T440DRAFT_466957 [Plenodomus tracheiphilus IPT5]